MTPDVEQLYDEQIKPLPRAIRLLLLARIAQDLAVIDAADGPELNLLELEGLGTEIWQGIDGQQYVNEIRNEWEQPHFSQTTRGFSA